MTDPSKPEQGACPADMVVVDDDGSITMDSETQARLEALLEAAGIGKLSTADGKAFADPDVLQRLTSTVSYALDEAAAALSRLRAESGNQGQMRSLPEACSDGDVATVRKLLKEGQSVHETTEEGETLLSVACSGGYYDLAEILLSMHASTEEPSPKGGCTPLMEAASGGFTDVVKLLIAYGADVNAISSTENTALMLACCGGHEEVVQLLIDSGADLEMQNDSGHTPLMEAASGGHVGVAKILFKNGAGINTHSDEYKESALTLACYKGHLEMVRFLLEAGADQEHKTDEMHTALMEASMDGHVDVARLLLDSGAQVNMPSDSFESPLTLAACGGHVALASLLVSRGANLEEINDEGYTPLMEASREGHDDVVSLLISHGADVNAITEETRETALTLAACGGFMDCCKLLVESGAELELGCTTPLMEAAQEGHVELIHYLVQQGAQVDFQSSSCSTALSHACEQGRTEAADALLSYGAFLEHESEGGRTPLMKACRCGHLCTVQYLLSRGANLNKMTKNKDHTPLSLACSFAHTSIVELLLLRGANPAVKLKDGWNVFLEACKGGQVNIVQTLLELPRLPNTKSYSLETAPLKSPTEEHPSRVPTQALPIVVPPQDPDPVSPTQEKKSNLTASESEDEQVNDCMELSELEERIKKIIETNVRLKIESKHLAAIHNSEDSRLLKKQKILAQLQKVEVDLQGKATQQLRSCLNSVEFDKTKMMERDVPDGCDLASEERLYTSDDEDDDDEKCCRHDVESNDDNVSPAVSTFSLGKGSGFSEDFDSIFDVNGCTENNNDSALSLASSGGHVEVVLLLLKRNVNIEHRDKKGFTPLILAASGGHVHVVNELLDAGANIESQSERTKDTPLSLACSGGRIFVVQSLVERGANIEHRNVSDYTPLSLAASGGYVNVIELLLHAGAEINSRTGSKLGISPLMLAAMNGHTDAVLTLLEMGADINAQIETNRNTALTLACFQGRHEVVTVLVERRANVEHRAKTGLTPLMEAASGGYAEVGKVLLDKGSDPNAPPVPSSKDTALTIAADKGHLRFCELILSRGAIVDARNKKGNTSFWLACNGGYLDVAKLLAQHGADINAVDNRNVTPLMAAFRRGHIKVVKWLTKIVKHFPTDAECVRYMSSITDRDLLKRCHVCVESIGAAKERQGQQADKVMSALLEEINQERAREENRREKAVRKREKRKKKRQERQTSSEPDPIPSDESQTTDTSSGNLDQSKTQNLALSPVTSRQEANTKSSKPTVTKSTPQQHHNKKPQHRKDEGWKEVVRKSKKVSVPSTLIARIIGRGGCNINAIRDETGAHIDINRQKKGLERIITIRGPNHAIRHAYFLITELMKDENSNKDIASIFQTVKRDNPEGERTSKKQTNSKSAPSPDVQDDTPRSRTSENAPTPPPKATFDQKKQVEVTCNTPTLPDIPTANQHVASTQDQPKQPESPPKANQVLSVPQSSETHETLSQFNSKLPSKSINRPVQPVAPMIATTPKNIQSQTTQVSSGLKTIARVEPQWPKNPQSPPQHPVISAMNNLNVTDLRQIYSNNGSGRPDNDRGLDGNTLLRESNRTIMHQTNQGGHEVLEASYNMMQSPTSAMQQRKIWPIGTERAFQRRAAPLCEPVMESQWNNSYSDYDAAVGSRLWMRQQPMTPQHRQGNPFHAREHANSSAHMHMMPGRNMMSQMTGIPNEYNGQQRLQAERNMGVHLAGYSMTGHQSPSSHFSREGLLHMNAPAPFQNQEGSIGQGTGMATQNTWPFIERHVKGPIHPGQNNLDPIGHMKPAKGMTMKNKNVNYTMPGMQMHSQGMHMSVAGDGSNGLMHGGSSGATSYVSPDSNPIWKW